MHPRSADIAETNLIWWTNGNWHFDNHIIHNGIEFCVDTEHAHIIADRRSIQCILFAFDGVTVHLKFGERPCIVTHSTDSGFDAFYIAIKMAEYFCLILAFIGIEFLEPIRGLDDTQPTIDIIQMNRNTSQVRHITVPISYIHKKVWCPESLDG